MYGFEINIGEIENVELSVELPTIKLRTNGFGFGNIKIGFTTLINLAKADY